MSIDDSYRTADMDERDLSESKYVFDHTDIPQNYPNFIKRLALGLTYTEMHAAQIGLIGWPVGMAFAVGQTETALGVSLAAVSIAFGLRVVETPTAAQEIVKKEPWYFLVVYSLCGLLGATIGDWWF